jgi:hypothetical protein
MKNSTMNTEITKMANRLAVLVNRWEQVGSDLTDRALTCLSMDLDFMSFENATTKSMFFTAVVEAMRVNNNVEYIKIFPLMYMDQNGNYTTDQSKWA